VAPSHRDFFCQLKDFKRIAMRADNTDQSFAAMIISLLRSLRSDESQQALEREAD
jgi:hypothetical protein